MRIVNMISASDGLQPHGICTQEDKYIQLVFFSFQNCSLLFSYFYLTFAVLDRNQMRILFLFLWKRNLVLPQNHCHQYTLFWLFYWYIGYKTDPHNDRNVQIFFLWEWWILMIWVLYKEYIHDNIFKWTKNNSVM